MDRTPPASRPPAAGPDLAHPLPPQPRGLPRCLGTASAPVSFADLVFLSAYCGSGLVIQVSARRQPTPSRLSASRMVSRLTRSAVIPCSAQTSAARASVHVERAFPDWRGLW